MRSSQAWYSELSCARRSARCIVGLRFLFGRLLRRPLLCRRLALRLRGRGGLVGWRGLDLGGRRELIRLFCAAGGLGGSGSFLFVALLRRLLRLVLPSAV